MASADIASLPVQPLEGEELLKNEVVMRYSHLGVLMGSMSLTTRRIVLRDGFMWFLARHTRTFELSEVTVGDSDIPWFVKPNQWLGGVWWLESGGKKLHFLNAWFSRWIQDIRKAQSKLKS